MAATHCGKHLSGLEKVEVHSSKCALKLNMSGLYITKDKKWQPIHQSLQKILASKWIILAKKKSR